MPDDPDARFRQIVREELERVGIYAASPESLQRTRRNSAWVDRSAEDDERRKQEAEDERRTRETERYKTALSVIGSIFSYGIAGTIGATATWFFQYIRGHH